MSAEIHCALVHHPVRDREGLAVASTITNVDVHDLARSARTYGLAGYWIVSPITAQRILLDGILEHWQQGSSGRRIPERKVALSICHPASSVEAAIEAIRERTGAMPMVWVTGARAPEGKPVTSYPEARMLLREAARPTLILFGTAHGLHPQLVDRADLWLAPIQPDSDFNHLSVRAAAAITLDRLLGDRSADAR